MYTDYAFTCCNIDVNEFRSFKLTPSVKSAKAKFYVPSKRLSRKVWYKSTNCTSFQFFLYTNYSTLTRKSNAIADLLKKLIVTITCVGWHCCYHHCYVQCVV